MDLRAKLSLVIAGMSVLVATVLSLLVHNRTAVVTLDAARRGLDVELTSTLVRHQEGQDTPLTTEAVPEPLAEVVGEGTRVTYLQDGVTLWAATKVGGQTLSLRRPYDAENAELAQLDRILLWSGLAATLLASGVGFAVAGGLSRRIRAVARTAAHITEGDLSARVGARGRDEIAAVGAALDQMADALRARLEAEQRVTADIAHELRTPVAGLVTAAGLLPSGRPAELVRDSAATLRRLVEDILEVARLDASAETPAREKRPAGVLARRAVAASGVPGVEIVVSGEAEVETDPRRVERILANLVINAARHGAPPVLVSVDGPAVMVRDHGPGFSDAMLTTLREHGPQRFVTGSAAREVGVGLGLTIAAGQARVLGAALTFANAPDGGAVVRLDLG
ncbi:sensor histidine kinase [Streptosporangium carneum]|uniref:histidine kinase n=1 Tax=Streptosporangium carneum TaxID=47481 RepID=A0A9W6I0W7_9ACTN|nr:HAMP domain-containing sensor histidine kinase [Streptosporangium carneum]GLK08989.1 sensor protein CseC [Streptosporangium carneum]